MKAPLSWIRQFVDIQASPQEIAEKLSLGGLEVDAIHSPGEALAQVLTATVLTCEQHPNADRLSVCEVRAGDQQVNLVCGAKNVRAGAKVALALPGVTLPNGVTLHPTTIRGVASSGMLCSEKELGLQEESEGILILPENTPEGIPLSQTNLIQNSYPHSIETILEINVTPNRGDCLSIRGIAREIAALFGLSFNDQAQPGLGCEPQRLQNEVNQVSIATSSIQVQILDPKLCPRYTGRILRGIQVKPSIPVFQNLLKSCGIRPINNIVDATNYVMYETGQPLHAFDLAKLEGNISVRNAKNGESLKTLDDFERSLNAEDLVIADEKKALALAGVMGGADSAVRDATVDVFLESAYFDPATIRKTSKRLGLSSDSSYRFERGIDPQSSRAALDYLTHLIFYWAGAHEIQAVVTAGPGMSLPAPIFLKLEKAEAILGIALEEEDVLKHLTPLGIIGEASAPRVLEIQPPSFRQDLSREIDLIEEIARLKGDEAFPAAFPQVSIKDLSEISSIFFDKLEVLRSFLVSARLSEIIHYSFSSEKILQEFGEEILPAQKLLNPISEDLGVLRSSLIPQMVHSLQKNIFHGNQNLKFFELRPVYLPGAPGQALREEWRLSIAMTGLKRPLHFSEKVEDSSFFDLKGLIENLASLLSDEKICFKASKKAFLHPKRQVELHFSARELPWGYLGELHPQQLQNLGIDKNIVLAEITLEDFLLERKNIKRFQGISGFPQMQRDLNLIVDEAVSHAGILEKISQHGSTLMQNVALIDVYRGKPLDPAKKAMTYRLIYGSLERTLTDAEVNQAQADLLQALNEQLSVSLREA